MQLVKLATKEIFLGVFIFQFGCVVSAADKSTANNSQSSNCASMIWPDGHETKIRNYKEMTDFLAACDEKPGTCKFEGELFPPTSKEESHPGSKVLADALVTCMLGPLPEVGTSPRPGRFDRLTDDKSDDTLRLQLIDPSKVPQIFSAQAKGKLTADRLRSMDIDFFNEFWVKNESPTWDRVKKIHELGEQGFKVAELAEKLYNFAERGVPSFRSDYLIYWRQLKALAEEGDPSAQCLFASVAVEYRSFSQDPPTKHDADVLAPYYRKAAAAQGHPYCLALWVNVAYRDNPSAEKTIDMRCAEAGASLCQKNIADSYFIGYGLPKDWAKSFCWIAKARKQNGAPSIAVTYKFYYGRLQQQFGDERLARLLHKVDTNADCSTITSD